MLCTPVHACITARLDYCSTYCIDLLSSQLSCLYIVLRILSVKYQNIIMTPHMLDVLHWRPVQQRIEFRVISLVWQCQLGLAPVSEGLR